MATPMADNSQDGWVLWDGNGNFWKEESSAAAVESRWVGELGEASRFRDREIAVRFMENVGGYVVKVSLAERIGQYLRGEAGPEVKPTPAGGVAGGVEGGYAFARPTSDTHGQTGMSLRDYFAGQALVGLLAFPSGESESQLNAKPAADEAFRYADAMVARRAKKD